MKAPWIFEVTNYLGFTEVVHIIAQSSDEARAILDNTYEYGLMECHCKGMDASWLWD